MSSDIEIPGEVVKKPQTPVQRLESGPNDLDMERVQLLMRLLIGAANEGSEYLLDHLRRYQPVVAELAAQDPRSDLDSASRSELIRYLAVGAVVRTQRGSVRLVADSIGFSFSALRRTASIFDRLTDNPIGRPLRSPLVQLNQRLADEINASVMVGHREVVDGSILVREAALDIMDELIAYISESPELAELVRDQIGQQSASMATAMAKTGREVTGQADRTIEDTIRGWLGLMPRREMPPSPFVGKPDSIVHPGLTPPSSEESTSQQQG